MGAALKMFLLEIVSNPSWPKTKDCREKAQEAQMQNFSFATFCVFSRPFALFDFEASICINLAFSIQHFEFYHQGPFLYSFPEGVFSNDETRINAGQNACQTY